MTPRNPWQRPRDGDPRMTDATDGDRPIGGGPTVAPTPAGGIEAMNGEPIPPLTAEEQAWMRRIAAWYVLRCREVGVAPPGDILRCIAACANEVVSFNEALAEQARRDAMGDDGEPDKPVRH